MKCNKCPAWWHQDDDGGCYINKLEERVDGEYKKGCKLNIKKTIYYNEDNRKHIVKCEKDGKQKQMITVKDYLLLQEISTYLDDEQDEQIKQNNGFSNKPIEKLSKMIIGLDKIIKKIEQEE